MHKCPIVLTMTDQKGKLLFKMEGRRNAVIKRFIAHSIKQMWVIKFSLIDTLKENQQFDSVTELCRAWFRKETPFEEDEENEIKENKK